MKALLLAACLLLPGGDREKGLQLYQEGKFAEAAAAFRAAIASEGESPDLQWNLALASWRAGDLVAAETAAEKYAALAPDARRDLHRGLLGTVRHGEAQALEAKADAAGQAAPVPNGAPQAGAEPVDPLPLLEQALGKAEQARDHFVAGAADQTTPELLRNTERTLRYIDALQKKIEELKKQREEQKKDDQNKDDQKDDQNKDDQKDDQNKDDQKDDQKKDGEQKPDDKNDPQQKDDKKDDKGEPQKQGEPQGKEGEEKPEPKPGDQKQGEPKDGDQKPQPEPQQKGDDQKPQDAGKPQEPQRSDAPGEVAEGKELSAEQTQRLLEQLKDLDQKMKALRVRSKSGRRPVERDW